MSVKWGSIQIDATKIALWTVIAVIIIPFFQVGITSSVGFLNESVAYDVTMIPTSFPLRNLLSNPGFESWSGGVPNSWIISNGSIGQATDAHSGSSALRLGGDTEWTRVYQDVAVNPNTHYILEGWHKPQPRDVPVGYTRMEIVWLDGNKKETGIRPTMKGYNYYLNYYEPFSSGPYTSPPSARYAEIAFVKPGWGFFFVDDVSFTAQTSQNIPPIATFNIVSPITNTCPLPIYLDASASYDPDGSISQYTWNFGDEKKGSGKVITHTFDAGSTVTLTVTDNLGASNSASKSVSCVPPTSPPPTSPPPTSPPPTSPPPTNGGSIVGFPFINSILAGIIAVILIIAIILYFRSRNNLSIIPKQGSAPADGTSNIPIRVCFRNGFGHLKNQKTDREIEFVATSGTIQSITIPEGKSQGNASLHTSRECGKVKITARCDDNKSTAEVEFTCPGGNIEITSSPVEIPADGKSSAMVTLRLVDPTGNSFTFNREKEILVSTTLGSIRSPVKLPKGVSSVNINLTSGQVSGSAVITAILDKYRGEAKVIFKPLEKHFCMHCGAPRSVEDKVCPSCGKQPPSGVDTKLCTGCGNIIPGLAKYCDTCGARQPE
jgi:hypothetical protein